MLAFALAKDEIRRGPRVIVRAATLEGAATDTARLDAADRALLQTQCVSVFMMGDEECWLLGAVCPCGSKSMLKARDFPSCRLAARR